MTAARAYLADQIPLVPVPNPPLFYGADTDRDRLFDYCTRQAGHRDFFVRKAIGWALRQYAYTDPEAVSRYVSRHRDALSPLSVREATKHLPAG